MKKFPLLAVLFFLPFVLAEEAFVPVSITLVSHNGESLADHIVLIEREGVDTSRQELYINLDSTVKVDFPVGIYTAVFRVRSLDDTPRFYYGEKQFQVDKAGTQTATVFPVAYIMGIVMDEVDNLVIDAELSYQCDAPKTGSLPTHTDGVGSFSLYNMPMGKCRIFARSGNSAGFAEVDISSNILYDITITLDKKRAGSWFDLLDGLFLVIGVLLLILIVFFTFRSGVLKGKTKEKQDEVPERRNDLVKTLNDNEKEVVKYLLENEGCTSQSKIRYATGIAKTSMFRCINSLERKSIVTTRSIGKMKTVELTEFFLYGAQK